LINIVSENDDDCLISIDGELTIYNAMEIDKSLLENINKYQNISLDLNDVSEMDTACYQLLLQKFLLCKDRGKAFVISTASPQAQEVFELYGDSGMFGEQSTDQRQ